MKLKRLNWILISTFFIVNVIGDIPLATAQEKDEKREIKVEMKKSVTDEGGSIQLRIEKADGSVYERSYANEDEMRNDPELQDMDFQFFGDAEDFSIKSEESQDGKFEVIIKKEEGEGSNRVMIFKSEDGSVHEFQDGDLEWIQESEEGADSFNFFFKNDGEETYKILKDENGEIQIEKNGELMDISELEKEGNAKVDIGEDGTITIREGDENNQSIMIFKSVEGDPLENEFIFTEPGVHLENSDNGSYIISMDVESDRDGDGNQKVIVRRKLEKIRIKIQDIENINEISEVPGLLLNEGKDLNLEEVDYYPNPSQGPFNLRFKGKKKPIEIKILDLKGQEIYDERINDFDGIYDQAIDLSGNEPGLYILQVIQNDKSWTKKILIE